MLVAFDVSHLERSRLVRLVQPENRLFIVNTLAISHAESPSILVSDEQKENMQPMLVTLDVTQPDRSAATRFEQPLNVSFILRTLEVFQSDRSMLDKLVQFLRNR